MFTAQTDRAYMDTTHAVEILDPVLRRQIRVEKKNSRRRWCGIRGARGPNAGGSGRRRMADDGLCRGQQHARLRCRSCAGTAAHHEDRITVAAAPKIRFRARRSSVEGINQGRFPAAGENIKGCLPVKSRTSALSSSLGERVQRRRKLREEISRRKRKRPGPLLRPGAAEAPERPPGVSVNCPVRPWFNNCGVFGGGDSDVAVWLLGLFIARAIGSDSVRSDSSLS